MSYSSFASLKCLKCMSLDSGRKPENPEGTHAATGRTCKLHTEGPPWPGIEPMALLLWGDSDSHYTTVQPREQINLKKKKYLSTLTSRKKTKCFTRLEVLKLLIMCKGKCVCVCVCVLHLANNRRRVGIVGLFIEQVDPKFCDRSSGNDPVTLRCTPWHFETCGWRCRHFWRGHQLWDWKHGHTVMHNIHISHTPTVKPSIDVELVNNKSCVHI